MMNMAAPQQAVENRREVVVIANILSLHRGASNHWKSSLGRWAEDQYADYFSNAASTAIPGPKAKATYGLGALPQAIESKQDGRRRHVSIFRQHRLGIDQSLDGAGSNETQLFERSFRLNARSIGRPKW
jgi:hypothetical protein